MEWLVVEKNNSGGSISDYDKIKKIPYVIVSFANGDKSLAGTFLFTPALTDLLGNKRYVQFFKTSSRDGLLGIKGTDFPGRSSFKIQYRKASAKNTIDTYMRRVNCTALIASLKHLRHQDVFDVDVNGDFVVINTKFPLFLSDAVNRAIGNESFVRVAKH